MVVTKPLESGSAQSSHTGHGAASVIPHLREREPFLPLEDSSVDEAAGNQQPSDIQGADSQKE